MHSTSAVSTQSAAGTGRLTQVLQIGLAAFLGVFLLWGVGFSHIDVLHNAAHDTRHSNAFPCH
ncbi:CbtB domain-containing protein [Ferrovibrio xuzhouensis]|uniref:CbtB-domain containing protein n=1 Tax=Ferrovibrio xuzhouensis TaxID=1576914 RepID=A0ABV7VFL4_9PROT